MWLTGLMRCDVAADEDVDGAADAVGGVDGTCVAGGGRCDVEADEGIDGGENGVVGVTSVHSRSSDVADGCSVAGAACAAALFTDQSAGKPPWAAAKGSRLAMAACRAAGEGNSEANGSSATACATMGPPLYVSIGAATADNGAAVTAVASTSLAATGAGAGAAT